MSARWRLVGTLDILLFGTIAKFSKMAILALQFDSAGGGSAILMFSQPIPQEKPTPSASISVSLQDLLDDRDGRDLSEYLSLSVSCENGITRISLTTTGNNPVTYSTVVSSASAIDWPSLVFVVQHDSFVD